MWVNGAPLGERFRQRSAYVAQEELFMPTLDAWETLEFQAVLRNSAGLTKARLHERMHDVMAVMGLSRVRHTQASAQEGSPVCGLSLNTSCFMCICGP